jgi:Fe-S-cluster-containing dehydrogenase component
MSVNRRDFIKIAGVTGCSLLGVNSAHAKAADKDIEFSAMLIDTTLCEGCRSCEEACYEKNRLPKPDVPFDEESVFEEIRDTSPEAYTVLNRYPNPKDPENPIFVRRQCMHCNQPACASACLVRALEKKREGPVIYNKERCMGCRYCMISCPFDVPKFEYDSPLPYIKKCVFCYDRQIEGKVPACAYACPTEATLFGPRRKLLEIARERIYKNPDRYVHHIYGEHEVGGTSVMYLSAVPFEQIGFRTDLGTTPYPEHTSGFLYGVPLVFVLWPSFLLALNYFSKHNGEKGHGEKD